MVLNIAGGSNAREKQLSLAGGWIGNFAQIIFTWKARISYRPGSWISFAPG